MILRYAAFFSLALTCRKLSGTTYPILYQCIVRSPRTNFATSLFRTLIDNEKLSRHVHYLELERAADFTPRLEEITQWENSAFEQLQRVAAERADSEGPIFSNGNTKGPEQIALFNALYFATLASMVVNLQEAAVPMIQDVLLWLVFFPTNRHDTLKRVWLTSGTSGHWSNCKVPVEISSTESDISFFLQHILDILPAPANLVECFVSRIPSSVENQSLPPMEELNLKLYIADPNWIDHHIRGCAMLKRLSCLWEWAWAQKYFPQIWLDLPRLRESLTHVKESLTHLTIDTPDYVWRAYSDQWVVPLGSIREFGALTYLKVDGLALLGDKSMGIPRLSTILPPSLVKLVLKIEWHSGIERALCQLSDDCATSLPNLRKLDCTWKPADKGTAIDLQDIFEAAGVDLWVEWEGAETESEDDCDAGDSLDSGENSDSENNLESEMEETSTLLLLCDRSQRHRKLTRGQANTERPPYESKRSFA